MSKQVKAFLAVIVTFMGIILFIGPWPWINVHPDMPREWTQRLKADLSLSDSEKALCINIVRNALRSENQAPADPPDHLPELFSLRDKRPLWVTFYVAGHDPLRIETTETSLYRSLVQAVQIARGDETLQQAILADPESIAIEIEVLSGQEDISTRSLPWMTYFVEPGIHGLHLAGEGYDAWISPLESLSLISASQTNRVHILQRQLETLSSEHALGSRDLWRQTNITLSRFQTLSFAQRSAQSPVLDLLRGRSSSIIPIDEALLTASLEQGKNFMKTATQQMERPLTIAETFLFKPWQPKGTALPVRPVAIAYACKDHSLLTLVTALDQLKGQGDGPARERIIVCLWRRFKQYTAEVWPVEKDALAPLPDTIFTENDVQVSELLPKSEGQACPSCRSRAMLALVAQTQHPGTRTDSALDNARGPRYFAPDIAHPGETLALCRYARLVKKKALFEQCLDNAQDYLALSYPPNLHFYEDYLGTIRVPDALPCVQCLPDLLSLWTHLASVERDNPQWRSQADISAAALIASQVDQNEAYQFSKASQGAFIYTYGNEEPDLFYQVQSLKALDEYKQRFYTQYSPD